MNGEAKEVPMTTTYDKKGRPIGFLAPPDLPVEVVPVERRSYRRRATESSQLLAALGHPIRIAILLHAKPGEEYAASDLSQIEAITALDTDVANVAHHLKRLAAAELFRPTRLARGKRAGIKQMYEISERGRVTARICAVAEKMLTEAAA